VRPEVRGPFLFLGNEKFIVKAVTYGTFAPDDRGDLFPPREQVRRDFSLMREANVNTVRTYTVPPDWFFEEARAVGLKVLVGIYWEGRNCTFDAPGMLGDAMNTVRDAVVRCRPHADVVLAYVIGNEIPPLVARFHGRRTIERFLRRLYDVAKEEDLEGLVTYGNYPTTEFLQLHFLDFQTLNVFLLSPEKLSAYLDRILIEVKGKPLLIGEIGDDSIRRGEEWQSELLDWTIPLALDKGICGLCVFSWTDEWVVGGHRVEDWAFGLVTGEGHPKPALEVVRRRFGEYPFSWREEPWPRVSVVVCNYNGNETLDETLSSLEELDYPDYEVILVEDGSTDSSLEIGRRHEPRVRVIARENKGLSAARNVGAEAATGEIVAYIDSDAYADPDWLRFLVLAMDSGPFSGAGGPNLTPESDGLTSQFIALCPGNPTYVLKDNRTSEHIAGVNMAFRRDLLLSLGGFDPVHRAAGDDVDICWRFEDAGLPLAFSPAAIVWHHRRSSIRTYLKQQSGYGVAENQLERKHPERFNLTGHIRWHGRVYQAPRKVLFLFRPFIYHGRLGGGLFQTLYQKDPSYLMDAPRSIQWYLMWAALLALSPLSLWATVLGLGMLSASVWVAVISGWTIELPINLSFYKRVRKVWTIGLLHFLHPLVRTWGRIRARLNHLRPVRPAARIRWLRPDYLVPEVANAFRRTKEIRRYWGPGAAEREDLLAAIQQELKFSGKSTTFGQEWENHDIGLNGYFSNEGRLFSSTEQFDQALCFGFRVCTTRIARWSLRFLTFGAVIVTWAAYPDLRFSAVFALPLLGRWWVLAQRARMRVHIWHAVEVVMERVGAKRFETPGSAGR